MESYKPFVSVCMPTYNRRPFIQGIKSCFVKQDYPQHRMEWIIVDDGSDKVGDLFLDLPNVKYFPLPEKMPLGQKRNFANAKCTGDIIVYMDDDDFYPPTRVSHAVERLTNSKALCAGSSTLYLFFKDLNKIIQFGPYNANHATAGTFAFKRQLLRITSYEDNATMAEEKYFLKNYTIPFVQLDPMKTILVFSHRLNTFDKKTLLVNPHPEYVRPSGLTPSNFIADKNLRDFYENRIHGLLKKYRPISIDAKTEDCESKSTGRIPVRSH